MTPRKTVVVAGPHFKALMPRGRAAVTAIEKQFSIEELENGLRTQVQAYDTKLKQAMHSFADATLATGEALSNIQGLLKPRGEFDGYLKTLAPTLPRSTAYKFIAIYERIKSEFPPMIVEKLIVSGIPIAGRTEDKPFGRYTKVVKKLGLPHGPLTEAKASEWVQSLNEKYRSSRSPGKRTAADRYKLLVKTGIFQASKWPDSERFVLLGKAFAEIAANFGLVSHLTLGTEKRIEATAGALETTFATARPAGKGRGATAETRTHA